MHGSHLKFSTTSLHVKNQQPRWNLLPCRIRCLSGVKVLPLPASSSSLHSDGQMYSDLPPIPPLHPSRRTPPQSRASPCAIRRQLVSFVLHCSRSCASPLLEPTKNLPDEFPAAVPAGAPDAAPKLGISNKFIRGLCSDPQTEQLGFECYRRALLQPGFLPEKKTANALTVQLFRAKQWGSLELLVEDFRAYGVLPEKRTCARLVAGCIRARRFC